MSNDHGKEKRPKKSPVPLIVSVTIFAGLVLSYILVEPVNDFMGEAYRVLTSEDEERIGDWVDQLGLWGPLFIVAAMVAQMFLIVIPSPLLMIIAVLAYGPFLGAVVAIVAVLVAASAGYWIGRLLGAVTVHRLVGKNRAARLEYYAERYGLWVVFIARLSPVLSNDGISLVGGLLRLGYFRFMAATAAGIAPLAVVFAFLGESNQRLVTGSIIVTAISLAGLVAYIVHDRRRDKRRV
jgi:uncharacterized membrane protein YdjX (TVP38/TMEM64 family)